MYLRLFPILVAFFAAVAIVPATSHAAKPGDLIVVNGLEMPAGGIAGSRSAVGFGTSTQIDMSTNGRYVVFASQAEVLASGSDPNVINVYRKDRVTGQVVLVSRASGANGTGANRNSYNPKISGDGNLVAFVSDAKLAPTDTNTASDIYVRNVAAATTTLATPGIGFGVHTEFDLSTDGQFIAFATTQSLAPGVDTNSRHDVYRRKLSGGGYELVSKSFDGSSAGTGSGFYSDSIDPSIGGNGRWVAFQSEANNLIDGFVDENTPDHEDVFVRDMDGLGGFGKTYLVSVKGDDLSEKHGGNSRSQHPIIAGAPTIKATVTIAYESIASSVDASVPDVSAYLKVYVHDLGDGPSSKLVSRATGADGASSNRDAHVTGISNDGDAPRVSFYGSASNLGQGSFGDGSYVRDVAGNTTSMFSDSNKGESPGLISNDGHYVAWASENNPIGDKEPGIRSVFGRTLGDSIYNRGPVEHLSRPAGDTPYVHPVAPTPAEGGGSTLQWRTGASQSSSDGRYTVFASSGPRLPGASPGVFQIYRRDGLTGEIELVSRRDGKNGAPIGTGVAMPAISGDGNRVVFQTAASLNPADTDSANDIYMRDVAAGRTTLISRADGPNGAMANHQATQPVISANGNRVAFISRATNLGVPGSGLDHLYLRDIAANRTYVVDMASAPSTTVGDSHTWSSSLSDDGRYVAFATLASNLDPADAGNAQSDIYLRDIQEFKTTLLSRRPGLNSQRLTVSATPVVSGDGRYVAMVVYDAEAIPGTGPWTGGQVIRREVSTGKNELVSRSGNGQPANEIAILGDISADGQRVVFYSEADNLLSGQGGDDHDAGFIRNFADGSLTAAPTFGISNNNQGVRAIEISGDGRCLLLHALGHAKGTGPAGDWQSAYQYVLEGDCGRPEQSPRSTLPQLSGVSLKPKKFAVAKKKTAKVASASNAATASKAKKGRKGKKRTPKGTTIRFRLNTTADVRIAFQRRATGIKVKAGKKGGKAKATCRKAPARVLRRTKAKKRCVLWQPAGSILRKNRTDGNLQKVAFSGRIGKKALKPGSYRAVLSAQNAAGISAKVNRPFRVVRP